MCKMVGVLFFLGLAAVHGRPAKDELMFDMGGDTAVVESTVREARQAPEHIEQLLKPGVKNAFIHTYGDKVGDKGDIHGYSKKLNDEGNDGYKHYDSFHKRDADKYGYQVHAEYGKANKGDYDSTNKKRKYKKGSGKGRDAQESQTLYRVSGEAVDDDKDKSALDDFDFVYFGGDGGSGKYQGGGGEQKSSDGKSGQYETNESYSSGGSKSYDSGDKGGSGAYSEGKSQSLSADDDDNGESAGYGVEEHENEEEEDDY